MIIWTGDIWTVTKVFNIPPPAYWQEVGFTPTTAHDLLTDHIEFRNDKGQRFFAHQRDYPLANVGDLYVYDGKLPMSPLVLKTFVEVEL